MSQEQKKKKSHTGRNVTITAVLLAALLGGGHFGLGIGRGGEGFLTQNSESAQTQTAAAEASAEPQAEETAPDDGVLAITVQEDKLLYQGAEVSLTELEEALLRDYTPEKTVTLTDDHAIKAAYDEAAALLDKLGIPY